MRFQAGQACAVAYLNSLRKRALSRDSLAGHGVPILYSPILDGTPVAKRRDIS